MVDMELQMVGKGWEISWNKGRNKKTAMTVDNELNSDRKNGERVVEKVINDFIV